MIRFLRLCLSNKKGEIMLTKLFKNSILGLALTLASLSTHALEVGEGAPCVVLDHVQKGAESTHCIREPQITEKPVVIEFFSITCSDCFKNLPQIKKLAAQLEGKATVRLVSIDRNESLVREYIKENHIDLEVAFDTEKAARKAYQVSVTPTLYVLDKTNTVIEKHTKVLTDEDLSTLVKNIESL